MPDTPEAALLREREWLCRLRWVDRAETAWLIALPAALGMWALALVFCAPPGAGLLAFASHVVLGACALFLAPRGKLQLWCGLVVLSQLHYLVWALMGYDHLLALALLYALPVFGVLLYCAWSLARLKARWSAVGGYTARDDFRWLVTASPLPLRWRVRQVLQQP